MSEPVLIQASEPCEHRSVATWTRPLIFIGDEKEVIGHAIEIRVHCRECLVEFGFDEDPDVDNRTNTAVIQMIPSPLKVRC